jgi:predicted transcriptional regulator
MPDRNSEVYSVDARLGQVADWVDMRPTTLLEQSLNNGFDRTTKPVGAQTQEHAEAQTTGGRGTHDAVEAIRIGATGRKK